MVEAWETQRREILVFEVGGRCYGLPACDVRELLRAVAILPLPLAPQGFEGVINLRGTVVAVLDLRARLGLMPRPIEPSDHLVVLQGDHLLVAVRIDRALELATLEVASPHPGRSVGAATRDDPGAVAKQGDRLIPLLDVRALVTPAHEAEIRTALTDPDEPGEPGP
ncbi:MAG TPA: chemotaxis protein CheW [Isosphaeraceae bacterium]|jgi:purine-binding chemotaxis protein CheW